MSSQPWVLGVSAAERPAEERQLVAAQLARIPQGVLLSTCHRVELYGFGEPPPTGGLHLETGERAVVHLMRVAAGLESAVVGEDEVLHQVRGAIAAANLQSRVDGSLQRLFQLAIAGGRRARAGRALASAGLAARAVDWLGTRGSLAGRPVVVAGSGRMGAELAHAARKGGALVTIASRDPERARRLAQVYQGEGVDLAEGARLAQASSAVAIALSGTWHHLEALGDPLPPIADISAPSAVPAAVRLRLNGGFLCVDDLFAAGAAPPPGYVARAETVVAEKAFEYLTWLGARS